MHMKKISRSMLLIILGAMFTNPAVSSTIVFSDNFDDGNVSDWTTTTNYSGPNTVTSVATIDYSVSPSYGLQTYLDKLNDPAVAVNNIFVRANHDFSVPVNANYTLDLWARSTSCGGCTISYDVLVDGVLLDRKFKPDAFEFRSFALVNLAVGTHTLSVGMFTNYANVGRFFSAFDDVSISTTTSSVPESPALPLLITGLVGWFGFRARRKY